MPAPQTVLIVEDDEAISDSIAYALDRAGSEGNNDAYQLQQVIRRVVGRWVNRELKRRPMIIPVVIEA